MIKVAAAGTFVLLSSAGISAALQSVFPAGLETFLNQLPFVGVVVWLVILGQKWRTQDESMWEQRRERGEERWEQRRERDEQRWEKQQTQLVASFKETLQEQRELFTESLKRLDARNGQYADRLEMLTQQMAMNTATVNEVAKLDDFVERVLEARK